MNWLPCFGRSKSRDNEREPLLPTYTNERGSKLNAPPDTRGSERSVVDKIVDVLTALENGKVPSQDQLSGFLQVLLKSRLLEEERGKGVPGNGPTSKQGRKVIRDTRDLIQALLQFGMEKNADDKLQELYFQVMQVESPSPIQGNTKSAVYTAGQTALDATKQAGAEFKDQAPTDQLAFDAATFLHALRTLFEICISSPIFRLLLADIFSIARDVVAHAAADLERAALHVQQTVAKSDDIISTGVMFDDVKDKGKEVAGVVTNAPQEIWNEWQVLGEDATDKTKERILERIQEIISRLQKDKASRSAMLAILILTRKYTEKIASASETVSEVLTDALKQTKDSFNSAEGSQAPNYPPHPYSSPKHEEKRPFFDVTSDALLINIRDMLQRLAGGYSMDSLLSAFSRVVQGLNDIPLVFEDEVNETIKEKLASSAPTASKSTPPSPEVPSSTPLPPGGGGKGKNKGKRRKKQKSKAEKESPLLPSESPVEESPGDATLTEEEEKGNTTETASNPFRAYFSRVGEYLDKALGDPGWAMSKDAAKALEVLFDDGVELVNVVDESVLEVGAKIVDSASTSKGTGEDEARRKFKNDLISLMNESEAYIAAFEKDRTTMKLLHALDALGGDLITLFSIGGRQGQRGIAESIKRMQGWTSWVGWAIPRILQMFPLAAIPIPSIEIKTANFEGALQSLFVQNLAHGETTTASGDPIASSFVPDEVVLKEWSELRIDMADYKRPLGGSVGPISNRVNSVHTTSGIHMHIDGVRARVEGLGYYFKYTGVCGFEYQDEGVLSVDVGMGSLHEGLGADLEIEVESDSTPLESASPTFEIPRVLVGGADGESEEDEADLDVQAVVGDVNNTSGSVSLSGADQPLFRVVDVRITLQGLRLRLDKTRHWILNTLFIQPFAGPMVARILRQALEDKVRVGMEVLASELGEVARDARKRGEERRVKRLREYREQEEDGEEGLKEFITDWWSALVVKLPAALGRGGAESEPREEGDNSDIEVEIETQTSAEATTKGVIFTNTTTKTTINTTEQPDSTPAMVYDKPTGSMKTVDLTMEVSGTPVALAPQQDVEKEEVVVAIGGEAQLFPGKPGPFGESSSDEGIFSGGVVDGIRDGVKKAVNGVVEGVQRGNDVVESVEERRRERGKKENDSGSSRRKRTWRSDAFDFL